MSFKHNKKRNVALVYEFLLREMSAKFIEEDKKGFKDVFLIFKKYFSPGCVLHEKKELFDAIRNNRGIKENIARKLLDEAVLRASKIDNHLCEIKESNLIKDINYGLGQDFFAKHKISEYKLLATIQLIFDSIKQKSSLTEDVKKLQLKENLVKFISSTPKTESEMLDIKVNKLVYSLAEEKFLEKYGKVLSECQKRIIARYIKSLFEDGNKSFKKFAANELSNFKKVLTESISLKEVDSDDIMKERMTKAIERINTINESTNVDELVEEVILYQKLVEEIQSNE
jgi:hypothetical protein